jgi:pimeloyl-ACP methyl ester carboxylesterase
VRAYLGPAPAPRIIAGHSLGGAIALLWALTVPREVRGLILMATGARLRISPVVLATLRADYNRGLEQLLALWFAPQANRRLKEKSQILLRAMAPEVLIAELRAADAFDVSAELGRLNAPTLVICGSDDQVTPPEASRQLHKKIPGSRLVIIEGAGHMVMLEQPRATNDAIQTFLQGLDETG